MKITKCKSCGLDVATVATKKGNKVVCDVYWDGDYVANTKNHQPVPHNCSAVVKRNKHGKKRF